MLLFATMLGLLFTKIQCVNANIFSQSNNDDGRHFEYPLTRNSTNPFNLPFYSSMPSIDGPTQHPSRSKSFHTSYPSTYQRPKLPSSSHRPSRTLSHRASPSLLPSFQSSWLSIKVGPPSAVPLSKLTSHRPSMDFKQCKSTEGDFGQITSNTLTVIYNYMMELSNPLPFIILPRLEIAVSDDLVASLITRCNMSNTTYGYANTTTNSSLFMNQQVLGISSSPPDMIQSNSCEATLNPKTISCYIVQGRLTLYLRPLQVRRRLSSIDAYNIASNTIKRSMTSGALARCHLDIVTLTYLNDGDASITLSNSTTDVSVRTVENKNTFTLVIAWALMGVLSAILVGIYLVKRGSNRRKRDTLSRKDFVVTHDNGIEVTDDNNTVYSSATLRLMESDWIDFRSGLDFESELCVPNSSRFSSNRPLDTSWSDSVKDEYDVKSLVITKVDGISNGKFYAQY